MYSIQKTPPSRSYHGECWRTMSANKERLKVDFHHKCAYCDDTDKYYGGSSNYHVDHFAPKSKFGQLEYDYDNLVYACPFCNRAKSDKWIGKDATEAVVGDSGFIDPCSEEYGKHLCRDSNGSIVPKTALGSYIYKELKLYLERHRICFMIDLVDDKRKLLKIKLEKMRMEGKNTEAIDSLYHEINETLITYYQMMFEENN